MTVRARITVIAALVVLAAGLGLVAVMLADSGASSDAPHHSLQEAFGTGE